MMTETQIYNEAAELVNEITRDGVRYFKAAIRKSGLNWTGSLENSVNAKILNEGLGFGLEIVFTFNDYWRFLDMKNLHYSTVPNIDAMRKFVESLSASEIPWVNGYKKRSSVSEKVMRERLLNAILAQRKNCQP